MILIAGIRSLIRAVAATPSMTGILISINTMSGINCSQPFNAPLDNLIWDRKLINQLFGFDYTWEIYTPANKRKFGYYVLPLLYGENFIGRAEIIVERKTGTLVVKNIWYENGVQQTPQLQTALNSCLQKFALFNDCETISVKGVYEHEDSANNNTGKSRSRL